MTTAASQRNGEGGARETEKGGAAKSTMMTKMDDDDDDGDDDDNDDDDNDDDDDDNEDDEDDEDDENDDGDVFIAIWDPGEACHPPRPSGWTLVAPPFPLPLGGRLSPPSVDAWRWTPPSTTTTTWASFRRR